MSPTLTAVRSGAAVLLMAAAGLLGVSSPASAAVCSSDTGVTVVVDFHQLGGGVQSACDEAGGGHTAADLFPANGWPLDYVQRTPGFVCRVSDKPADDPCVNTPPSDAYWGLYWSNGTSGTWSYSSSGAGGQKIPAGGSVAFSWQGSSSRTPPGIAPPKHASSSPSPSPTRTGGSGSGDGGQSGGGTSGGSQPVPSASASGSPVQPSSGASPGGSQGATSTAAASDRMRAVRHERQERRHSRKSSTQSPTTGPTAATSSSGASPQGAEPTRPAAASTKGGGLPPWIPVAVIGGLFSIAGGVAVARKRRA